MLTSIAKETKLSREVFRAKPKNAKLVDRGNDLKRTFEDVRSAERLACINQKMATAWLQTVKARERGADAKYAKMVKETAQTEMDLHFCVFTLES